VSRLRPAVKLTDPEGREWEIYVYKIRLRADYWDPRDPEPPRKFRERLRDAYERIGRSLREDSWTIEAVTWDPPRHTAYGWVTTSEYKGQVLAQVQGHLERGDVPIRLRNAHYRGERRSAR
jgi:hypothetical protein